MMYTNKRKSKKPKINLSKYEKDWLEFNKRNKSNKMDVVTLDEYVAYIHGKPLPTKQSKTKLKSTIPTYEISERNPNDIPSVAQTGYIAVRRSKTDLHYLEKETPEVREAIIAKSKRLAPAYSKGSYQYISDEAEIKTLGRKI